MPKKTASGRGGASRNKPKPQRSVQLVLPNAAVDESNKKQDESSLENETTPASPTSKAAVTSTATVSKRDVATTKKSAGESITSQKTAEETSVPERGGSAAARLAARRQAASKPQTTRTAGLITAEHYSYVRRDLIYILILAVIMFSVIIILHFVPAIGG
jgi:cobalamin biosynthesis Mg chelatase CobN